MAHGKGVAIRNDGSTYDGDWVKNKQCGYGVEKWENGSIF